MAGYGTEFVSDNLAQVLGSVQQKAQDSTLQNTNGSGLLHKFSSSLIVSFMLWHQSASAHREVQLSISSRPEREDNVEVRVSGLKQVGMLPSGPKNFS